ncbi:hypothetical protein GLOTRDRAFT_109032 [Gloeophyllum trabeum ATCC 11539]|uniref:Uncharacterized protein n=1 Tax=Gloeophyllum trabeum (strain ATCC 11539 / FP-39264 / Madison 617) TaxID=670483 RepID=S7QMG5_GLOTA|nr:uncharacterized protein GLOTRDRAFT_109032 [Gloeophyllum trabeum ATCC 11539]EPQ60592.1 hypothetical protein GLOTRDRAFT_109032 [Gloeophyllum trabeum ATCC 11539]
MPLYLASPVFSSTSASGASDTGFYPLMHPLLLPSVPSTSAAGYPGVSAETADPLQGSCGLLSLRRMRGVAERAHRPQTGPIAA